MGSIGDVVDFLTDTSRPLDGRLARFNDSSFDIRFGMYKELGKDSILKQQMSGNTKWSTSRSSKNSSGTLTKTKREPVISSVMFKLTFYLKTLLSVKYNEC